MTVLARPSQKLKIREKLVKKLLTEKPKGGIIIKLSGTEENKKVQKPQRNSKTSALWAKKNAEAESTLAKFHEGILHELQFFAECKEKLHLVN